MVCSKGAFVYDADVPDCHKGRVIARTARLGFSLKVHFDRMRHGTAVRRCGGQLHEHALRGQSAPPDLRGEFRAAFVPQTACAGNAGASWASIRRREHAHGLDRIVSDLQNFELIPTDFKCGAGVRNRLELLEEQPVHGLGAARGQLPL
jgi:hypothetical protein